MQTLNDLENNIREWGIARNITFEGGATIQAQASKGLEEMAELVGNLGKMYTGHIDLLIADEHGTTEDCDAATQRMEEAREKLKDDIGDVVVCMIQAARLADTNLTECLEQSWNDIKDRKGTMVDGKFVKESE